jgi:hypothetical protein
MLPAPRKVTRLERAMNRVVVAVLAALAATAAALGSANMAWEVAHRAPGRDWYLGQQVRTRRGRQGRGRAVVVVWLCECRCVCVCVCVCVWWLRGVGA